MTTRLPLNAIQTVGLPVRNGGVARHVEYYGTNILPLFHMLQYPLIHTDSGKLAFFCFCGPLGRSLLVPRLYKEHAQKLEFIINFV